MAHDCNCLHVPSLWYVIIKLLMGPILDLERDNANHEVGMNEQGTFHLDHSQEFIRKLGVLQNTAMGQVRLIGGGPIR